MLGHDLQIILTVFNSANLRKSTGGLKGIPAMKLLNENHTKMNF